MRWNTSQPVAPAADTVAVVVIDGGGIGVLVGKVLIHIESTYSTETNVSGWWVDGS